MVGPRRTGETAVRQGAYVGYRVLAQTRMTLRSCDERAQYAVHIRFTSTHNGALHRAFLGWNAAGGPSKQVAEGSCMIEPPPGSGRKIAQATEGTMSLFRGLAGAGARAGVS